jgi:hypothetical protein
MKYTTLVSLALSAANVATAVKFVVGPEGWADSIGFKTREQTWDDVKPSRIEKRAVVPMRQDLKPRIPFLKNSKSVKLRYGPFTVPAPSVPGGEGMLWNKPTSSVTKPCTKCMIIGMNAGLEYADGSDANTDTMMWLHHMVLFNIGTNAWDATCTIFGLPHMIIGALPATSERIFSSGNERTVAFFNPPSANMTKAGYPVYAADRFGLITDLMNMNPTSKTVWMTMYYDYIEESGADWADVKPVWFDVAQCGTSEVGGGSAGSSFQISSIPWSANFDGDILSMGGHIHDGGTKLDILVNKKVACTSTPYYGSNEEARARADIIKAGGVPPIPGQPIPNMKASPGGGGHGHAGGQHVVAMGVCAVDTNVSFNGSPASPLNEKKLVKGQSWYLTAYYNYKERAGMKNNYGGMDSVMGISIMFVKNNKKRG